ncbi:MAG: hypothetical protein IKC81_07235 [Paludibacteraceae bacterium]|nr:hypothetical protein [Paludibacteraceae bacterium]
MKKNTYNVRSFFLFFLWALCNCCWAVTLPSQAYSVYNPLYEANNDHVSMPKGVVFKGINHVLLAGNNDWGTDCVDEYGEKTIECRTCCGDKLQEIPLDQQADYSELHTTCLNICATGLPLGGAPLDMPFWFILPLCGLYGVIQYIRNKETEY